MLSSTASKLEGGFSFGEAEVNSEAKRKVLANIENHKREHKRWELAFSICIDKAMILCRWKDLLVERKEQSKRASGLAKDASEGKIKIEADQRWRIFFPLMLTISPY